MCLSEVWTNEEMEEWLAGQGEVIEVWKGVIVEDEKYRPIYDYNSHRYSEGISIAHRRTIAINRKEQYWSGYHFFLDKENADNFTEGVGYSGVTIKCLIRKDWVVAMGESGWFRIGERRGFYHPNALVASQAIFPHYPETEARYEDIEPFLTKEPEMAVSSLKSK